LPRHRDRNKNSPNQKLEKKKKKEKFFFFFFGLKKKKTEENIYGDLRGS